MSTAQALFSATLIAIMAAAGLAKGIDVAWIMAGVTAALAFFSEEVRRLPVSQTTFVLGNGLVVGSWIAGAIAGISLIVYS